eukprot:TRINITY_DN16467_c0_g1_i2.p1 TRINITY_DN16467_c0_g1~~TRINITY_DN16467_c0_g1_i2.p1  ORF type:complete len:929 (-),score=168.05 TRINITY_DN16467_c0_g1_i2:191-2827(-)
MAAVASTGPAGSVAAGEAGASSGIVSTRAPGPATVVRRIVATPTAAAAAAAANAVNARLPDAFDGATGKGRWRYHQQLGQGGLAVVHHATDMTGCLGDVAVKVLRGGARAVHAFELHREAQWSLLRLHNVADKRYDGPAAGLFVRCLEDHSGFPETYDPCHKDGEVGRQDCGAFEVRRRRFETDGFDWEAAEAAAAAAASGMAAAPNGVTALRWRPRPYIVLELLPGETLHVSLQRAATVQPPLPDAGAPLPQKQAAAVAPPLSMSERRMALQQLATAANYLARFGLIHRDFRACNIQMCQRAPLLRVAVLDLGVAIAAEEPLRCTSNPSICVFQGPCLKAGFGYDWLPWELRARVHVPGFASEVSIPAGEREDQTVNFSWPTHAFDAFSLGVLWLELFLGKQAAREVLKRVAAGDHIVDVVQQCPGACAVRRCQQRRLCHSESKRSAAGVAETAKAAAEAAKAEAAAKASEVTAVEVLRRLLGPAAKRPPPIEVCHALAGAFDDPCDISGGDNRCGFDEGNGSGHGSGHSRRGLKRSRSQPYTSGASAPPCLGVGARAGRSGGIAASSIGGSLPGVGAGADATAALGASKMDPRSNADCVAAATAIHDAVVKAKESGSLKAISQTLPQSSSPLSSNASPSASSWTPMKSGAAASNANHAALRDGIRRKLHSSGGSVAAAKAVGAARPLALAAKEIAVLDATAAPIVADAREKVSAMAKKVTVAAPLVGAAPAAMSVARATSTAAVARAATVPGASAKASLAARNRTAFTTPSPSELVELAAAEASLKRLAESLAASLRGSGVSVAASSSEEIKDSLRLRAVALLQAVERCRSEALALCRHQGALRRHCRQTSPGSALGTPPPFAPTASTSLATEAAR